MILGMIKKEDVVLCELKLEENNFEILSNQDHYCVC